MMTRIDQSSSSTTSSLSSIKRCDKSTMCNVRMNQHMRLNMIQDYMTMICTIYVAVAMICISGRNGMQIVVASPVANLHSQQQSQQSKFINHQVQKRQQQHHSYGRRSISTSTSNPLDILLVSSASTEVSTVPSTTTTTAEASTKGASSNGNGNIVLNLFGYVKDSIVRTVTGCGQLYTNHQRCNSIRQKQNIYRNMIKEQWSIQGLYDHLSDKEIQQKLQKEIHGGISYEEYIFLQIGKDDRGKVLNLGFLMWGAPRILPYALMFNKNMLPSPFTIGTTTGSSTSSESTYDTLRRERTQAIINTLLNMEKQMMIIASNNFMSNMNIFSKSKTNITSSTTSSAGSTNNKNHVLQTIVSETSDIFRRGLISSSSTSSSSSSSPTSSSSQKAAAALILQRCEPYLYRTTHDYTGLEQRLGHVPSCIVQGISNAVFGHGIPTIITQLTPAMIQRRKLIGHIEKITKADDFLIQSSIDISTIPKKLLQEACQDRMIDIGSHRTVQDLRNALSDWLQLTIPKVQPSIHIPSTSSSDTEVITASSTSISTPPPTTIYYNSNLARMILMAYYGCSAICDTQSICRLPQLLFQNCNK